MNESAYKILIITFHITLSYLFSLTKISKSLCADDAHNYDIYIRIALPELIAAVLPLQDFLQPVVNNSHYSYI